MKLARVITPVSTNSFVTSPTRLMFSALSASQKPRLQLRPCLMLSPSSRAVVDAPSEQGMLQGAGDCGLARAAEAGEPDHTPFLMEKGFLGLAAHATVVPCDMLLSSCQVLRCRGSYTCRGVEACGRTTCPELTSALRCSHRLLLLVRERSRCS